MELHFLVNGNARSLRGAIRVWSLLFALMLSATSALATAVVSLDTPYNSDNTGNGVMFDVVAANAVTLVGLKANLSVGSADFELYYRVGGYSGQENNAAAWTLLGTATNVVSQGINQRTLIPIPMALVMSAGDRIGFYLTTAGAAGIGTRYTNTASAGISLASDANITVSSGVGKAYPFAATYGYRAFNGTMDYGLGTVSVADLRITNTNGVSAVVPGTSVTYTITASNAGPSNAPGTVVTDTLPASLTAASWTCVGSGGGTCTASGSGNINDTVDLPSGGSVTYTLTATVSASASGTLSNTATVTESASIVDPIQSNNSATDSDTITPQADLSISKTDGVSAVVPGTSVTYTITASNAGPSNAPGTVVTDTLPASLTAASWTCVGSGGGTCTASGSGSINDTANLPSGGSVTYTLTATVSASASGTLSNTATVTAAGGITDPAPGNNSATDSDTITPRADLSISKTDGVSAVVPGTSVTYTITASNAGPSNAPGTVVADTLPASLSSASWTCVGSGGGTCTASGSGSINDTVNLPSGGSVTYTLTATLNASASGTLSNTATVTAAGGITDPTPGNNSATDSDTITPRADLSITLTDAPDPVIAGNNLTYSVNVANAGPSQAATVSWTDTLPANTTFVSLGVAVGWSCTTPAVGSTGTVVCSKATLAASGTAAFSLVVAVAPATPAATVLTNTVTISSVSSDPTPGNNTATATTIVSAAPVETPAVTIPLLAVSSACNVISWPSIVNLGAGEGPAFVVDMVALLSNAVGQPLAYVEQGACGSVTLSGYGTGKLAFVPHTFHASGDARTNGIYAVGDGRYEVVRNGQSLTLAPATVRLDQLTALFPGLAVRQGENGVVIASINGVTYAEQPGVAVRQDAATGRASLGMGDDGYWHFIDEKGNNQILYPAFADVASLRNVLLSLDARATLSIQLDGTASIVFNGKPYTLVPDLVLSEVPTERVGQYWWQESATRYWVANAQPLGTAQGFTVKP